MALKLYIIHKPSTIREAIKSLLVNNNEITILGTADNYSLLEPAIGLSDLLMIEHNPEMRETLDLIYDIQQQNPGLKILLLSDCPQNPAFLNQMLSAGISGYVSKSASAEELMFAIKSVKQEGLYISTPFILKVLEDCRMSKEESKNYPSITLNTGECDVLNLISQGLTNREIANELCTSVRTIEARRKKLLNKTNTTNTATLIKCCVKMGLVD